jgi:hypothetical protein
MTDGPLDAGEQPPHPPGGLTQPVGGFPPSPDEPGTRPSGALGAAYPPYLDVATHPADRTPRRRHVGFWLAVGVCLAAIVGGTVVAVVAYRSNTDPKTVVAQYFADLRRGDARGALALGDLPDTSTQYLTADVLAAQRAIAPMSRFSASTVAQANQTATVSVRYSLSFPDGATEVSDRVNAVQRGAGWRLASVAVPTQLHVMAAAQRASVAGAPVPSGSVGLFPGALPVALDTPNLMVDAASRVVRFSGAESHDVAIGVTPAGRRLFAARLDAALRACLTGTRVDPQCPLPNDDRAVPGTLRGSLAAPPSNGLTVDVLADPAGKLQASGTAAVTGRYQQLDFNNLPAPHTGTTSVSFKAECYATAPNAIVWDD